MSRWLIMLPLGAGLLLLAIPLSADPPTDPFLSPLIPTATPTTLNWQPGLYGGWKLLGRAKATFYGNEDDGFLGRRHASSWHNQTPPGFSEVVTACCEPGVALSTTWGVKFGDEVLVVWEDQKLAVRAIRVDAMPGMGADLYEWLYRELSPLDIGALDVALYVRRSIWDVDTRWRLILGETEAPNTNRAPAGLQQERWRWNLQIPHNGS